MGRSPTHCKFGPIYVKLIFFNIKKNTISLDEQFAYAYIQTFDDTHVTVNFYRPRRPGSGLTCRSFEKCIHFYFAILNILFNFSSQVLFWGLEYSILTRSMLCLIDKS